MFKRSFNFKTIKRFLPYLTAYPQEIITAIILGAVSGLASVWMTYAFGKAVDTMIGVGKVDFPALLRLLSLLAGILLITVISQWLIQRLGNRLSYLSVAKLRKDTYERLNHLPIQYYDQTTHGNIVSRFTNDMDQVSTASSAIFNQLFSGIATVLIALVFMIALNPLLTLVVLVTTPIIFIVNWLVARASQNNFSLQQKITGEMTGFVAEMVGHQKIVQAFQQEPMVQQDFEELNQALYDRGQKAQFSSSLTNPLSRFIDHLSYLAIGLVGGLLALQGTNGITVGIISSFTIYATQFSKPFIELSGIMTQIQTAMAGLERTFEIWDQPVEQPDAPDAIALTKVKGAVAFEHVYFAYNQKRPLIQDLQLHVAPGETIAIVGQTGAGKSTLVNLLMRFYELDAGVITVDGTSIQAYTRDSLRRSFGIVLQDTWLFNSTIRENLTYGKPDATDAEIIAACQKAHIHEMIQRLPQGYDTMIGEQGLSLSAGQRQLLTIARTMISDPPMLILDEATSSVDTLTESAIQDAFLKIMDGRTSFVIAHRLATIKTADKILVMDQGQIVEIGSHNELLKNPDGYYHALYHAQFA